MEIELGNILKNCGQANDKTRKRPYTTGVKPSRFKAYEI